MGIHYPQAPVVSAWALNSGVNVHLTVSEPIEARTENAGATGRIRGIGEVKAAEAIKVTEPVFVLPPVARPGPTIEQYFPTSVGLVKFLIESNGKIFPRAELAAGTQLLFDGVTYRMT